MIDINDMRILIVDDMENMCKSVRNMLKILNFGRSFRIANNGRDAWNILKSTPIDMAVIDWNMPVMTGIDLLSMIRNDPELRDMPIIMITAEAQSDIVAEAAESDIDAYLLKPLTIKSLGDKITSVIERYNNPPPMTFHLREARRYEEEGDITKAIEEAKTAFKSEPTSSRPIRVMGQIFLKSNDLANAEKCFIKAARMNRLDVFAFHNLGEIYLKQKDYEKASKFFEKAMEISPRHVSRGVNFANVLLETNQHKKAKKIFAKVLSLTDDPLGLREKIADLCMEHQFYDFALELYTFILEQIPGRDDIKLKAATIYEFRNSPEKALHLLLEVLKNKQMDHFETKLKIAKNYIALGQVLRADELLQELIKIEPDNEEIQSLLRQNI